MKLKKLLTPLMAVSLIAGAMPVTNVLASDDPRVYVDIKYLDNGKIRADIMFENMPEVAGGGFHFVIGDSWNFEIDNRIHDVHASSSGGTGDKTSTIGSKTVSDNEIFISFATSENRDFNGHFYSVYLEKAENFSPDNAEVNVVFKSKANATDRIATKNGTDIVNAKNNHSPDMLKAYEYKIGDINNDGYVDMLDTCQLMGVMEEKNNIAFSVDSIKHNYKNFFPDAICPAVPDADQDNMISQTDIDLITDYYVNMSTSGTSNSRVGKLDFYEFFDD